MNRPAFNTKDHWNAMNENKQSEILASINMANKFNLICRDSEFYEVITMQVFSMQLQLHPAFFHLRICSSE